MPKYSFGKEEKLKSRKAIAGLFNKGSSAFSFPIKAIYTKTEEKGIKIAVTASKRFFKKAVDRNQIKRRIREAYRLNKVDFKAEGLSIMFIYVGKSIEDYGVVASGMKKVLHKMVAQMTDKKL